MPLPMPDEAGAVGKGFSTLLTAIRLLSGVRFLVFQKVGATVEGFSTLPTFKGLLPGVNSLMFGDIGAVPEGFPTLVTLKGLLSSVNSLVANVICLVFKDPSAFTALIGLLPLERNEHRDTLKVIFERGVEGIKDMCFVFGAQDRLFSGFAGLSWLLGWLFPL